MLKHDTHDSTSDDMATKAASRRITGQRSGKAREKPKSKIKPVRLRRGQAENRIPEILSAAAAEFIEQGFLGARMDDIAARLGVSKPILYRHYKSKHALLEAVLNRELHSPIQAAAEQIRQYRGPLKPLIKLLFARVNPYPAATLNSLPMFRLVLSESHRVPAFAEKFFRRNFRAVNEATQAVFKRAMAEGHMRKADPEFASRELFGPYMHVTIVMTLLGHAAFDEWRGNEYLTYGLESFCRNYEIAD